MVTRQNGYNGPQFREICGTNQGELVFSILFNVAVDSVFQHWILLVVYYESLIQDGLGHAVVRSLVLFYAYDDLLGSQYPEWLQGVSNVLTGLFWWIGLDANVSKSKMMMCHPGAIILVVLEEASARCITGKVVT